MRILIKAKKKRKVRRTKVKWAARADATAEPPIVGNGFGTVKYKAKERVIGFQIDKLLMRNCLLLRIVLEVQVIHTTFFKTFSPRGIN